MCPVITLDSYASALSSGVILDVCILLGMCVLAFGQLWCMLAYCRLDVMNLVLFLTAAHYQYSRRRRRPCAIRLFGRFPNMASADVADIAGWVCVYSENSEPQRERSKQRSQGVYAENPEPLKELAKQRSQDVYAENPEPQKERSKQRCRDVYAENPEPQKERSKLRSQDVYAENPEPQKERSKHQSQDVPGYPERKRVLRLLDQSPRARISVLGVEVACRRSPSELRRTSVGGAGAYHVCSLNEEWQNESEAY